MARVELSQRALDDLEKLGSARPGVERVLRALAQEPIPGNLDITALRGKRPWRRLRAGSHRIVFRPLGTADDPATAARGYLVVRIAPRRELERIVRGL
jgi:plasmid stabilization system protein ParE